MFGIGLTELAIIAFVGVLAVGPDRLPELAKQAGHLVGKARRLATAARDDLRRELGPEYADLEWSDLDPRAVVREHLADVLEEGDATRAVRPRSGVVPPSASADRPRRTT